MEDKMSYINQGTQGTVLRPTPPATNQPSHKNNMRGAKPLSSSPDTVLKKLNDIVSEFSIQDCKYIVEHLKAQTTDEQLKLNAALALAGLTDRQENRGIIIETSGALSALVDYLKSPSSASNTVGKESVVNALANLSDNTVHHRHFLEIDGALSVVVGYLNDPFVTEEGKGYSVQILANLSGDKGENILSVDGVQTTLIEYLNSPTSTEKGKADAVCVLAKLVRQPDKEKVNNILRELVTYVHSQSSTLDGETAFVIGLSELAKNPENQIDIGAIDGILSMLVRYVSSDQWSLRDYHASSVLTNLALRPENKERIGKIDGVWQGLVKSEREKEHVLAYLSYQNLDNQAQIYPFFPSQSISELRSTFWEAVNGGYVIEFAERHVSMADQKYSFVLDTASDKTVFDVLYENANASFLDKGQKIMGLPFAKDFHPSFPSSQHDSQLFFNVARTISYDEVIRPFSASNQSIKTQVIPLAQSLRWVDQKLSTSKSWGALVNAENPRVAFYEILEKKPSSGNTLKNIISFLKQLRDSGISADLLVQALPHCATHTTKSVPEVASAIDPIIKVLDSLTESKKEDVIQVNSQPVIVEKDQKDQEIYQLKEEITLLRKKIVELEETNQIHENKIRCLEGLLSKSSDFPTSGHNDQGGAGIRGIQARKKSIESNSNLSGNS